MSTTIDWSDRPSLPRAAVKAVQLINTLIATRTATSLEYILIGRVFKPSISALLVWTLS